MVTPQQAAFYGLEGNLYRQFRIALERYKIWLVRSERETELWQYLETGLIKLVVVDGDYDHAGACFRDRLWQHLHAYSVPCIIHTLKSEVFVIPVEPTASIFDGIQFNIIELSDLANRLINQGQERLQ